MKNIKCTLKYDGTGYFGWQTAAEGPTIEKVLTELLRQVLQEPLTLQAASRTDAGVHAEGQVINFFTEQEALDLQRLQRSLNRMLPKTIQITQMEEAHESFHPTLNAIGKEYHYHIALPNAHSPFNRHYSWYLFTPLDRQKVRDAMELFKGTHDFTTFCNISESPSSNTECTITRFDLIEKEEGTISLEICGDHFLYKMARNLVGTVIYVGLGKMSLEDAKELLQAKDRKRAAVTAPAHALFLKKVNYPYD